MATFVTEPFSYTDGDLAGNGPWATCSSFANLNVASSKLKPNTGGSDGAAYASSYGGSTTEQWAQVTLSTAADFIGPTVFNDGAGTMYYADCVPGSSQIVVYRIVSGGFTSLPSGSASTALVNGDVVYFEAKVNGSQIDIIVKKNGSTVITVSDSNAARITSGKPGMRMWHADANARFDDYTAGDFSAGGSAFNPFFYRQHIARVSF